VSERDLARFPDLQPLVIQLLYNREVLEPGAVSEFLSGRHAIEDPFQLKGMSQAVTRLRQAIRRQERIAIYGDFDVDGVTATALLVQTLSALGGQVEPYIPDRVDEGYGLNLGALRRLWQRGVRLVVTVDCGIRSVDEVAQASRGLDLIITDHHSPSEEMPPALAVINPRQPDCPYPFKKLAAVGIAFKLAQALLLVQGRTPVRWRPVGWRPVRPSQGTAELKFSEEELLDLVALGTVADLVPLLGENRSLVRQGLKILNDAQRPGVEALMAEADLRRNDVDATAIGFRLGPRLNAAGRIGSAMLAYNLLMNRDPLETKALAERLGALNAERQQLTEETVAAAEAQVLSEHPDAYLYLAASETFNSGIVGLAASRLTEAFYRPSVVVELGQDWSRGSCRSIPEFHITHALDQCKDLLKRHGGHAAAAGFTVATARLDALRSRLQAIAAEQLADVELRPALEIDAEIPLEEANWATHDLLLKMEPCGVGNPKPVLLSRDLDVRDRRPMGSERKHLRLTVRDGRGVAWDGVYFGGGDLASQVPGRIDLAYRLEVNEWNHEKRLQLNIQDVRPATALERG
jgi:single-stranded-DNA-specific exonuclease